MRRNGDQIVNVRAKKRSIRDATHMVQKSVCIRGGKYKSRCMLACAARLAPPSGIWKDSIELGH